MTVRSAQQRACCPGQAPAVTLVGVGTARTLAPCVQEEDGCQDTAFSRRLLPAGDPGRSLRLLCETRVELAPSLRGQGVNTTAWCLFGPGRAIARPPWEAVLRGRQLGRGHHGQAGRGRAGEEGWRSPAETQAHPQAGLDHCCPHHQTH